MLEISYQCVELLREVPEQGVTQKLLMANLQQIKGLLHEQLHNKTRSPSRQIDSHQPSGIEETKTYHSSVAEVPRNLPSTSKFPS